MRGVYGWVFAAVCMAFTGGIGDTIYLHSGQSYEGELLRYSNGLFEFRLSDGRMARAQRDDVRSISLGDREVVMLGGHSSVTSHSSPLMRSPSEVSSEMNTAVPNRDKEISLASSWNMGFSGSGSLVHNDLVRLFSDHARAAFNPKPDYLPEIMHDVKLMDVRKDIERALNLRMPSKSPLPCAAFPQASFSIWEYQGLYEDGFQTLQLVTDLKDQVVAIQLVDESPKQTHRSSTTYYYSEYEHFNNQWTYFNFLEMKKKGSSSWYIKNVLEDKGQLLVINSALSGDRYGRKLKERVRLYLPKYTANMMMHIISLQR